MKSAFITGAIQGLGNGFVGHLLDQGWQVFGSVRKISEKLPEKANLTWIEMELADDDSIINAVAKVKKKTNQLELLVNNAGINKDTATDNHKEKVGKLGHLERAMLQKMFDINAIAPMQVLQNFLPLLTAPSSFVINISSCRASFHDELENSFANYGYRASKIALNMMTFVSTYDLPKNIQTFAVHPGIVRSSMNPTGSDDPKLQAEKIMAITKNWDKAWNGKFMRYDGTLYPL